MSGNALSGLRILDFSWVWAGPICTMVLADMGAEVIKIESRHRIDAMRVVPPFPEGVRGGFNRGGQFNTYNRNKKSCTLNLSRPEAIDIARRLVALSDAVVENFSPPVMTRLGLDYEVCRSIKPDIIFLSLSGYGATGPSRDFVSYGMQLQAYSGMASLTGYPDGPPRNLGTAVADTVGGLAGVFGILAAVHHRRRTGKGQFIDVAQCEGLATFCPEAILDYLMNGRLHDRTGNRDDAMVPHNVYPCRGEDKWVAIAVSADDEWQGLCEALGRPQLVDDPRFSDFYARHRNQDELDRIISMWTIQHDDLKIMHRLQAHGVPATAVLDNSRIVRDPHLKKRGFCVEDDHPKTGRRTISGPSFRLSRTPGSVRSHAPLLGDHNREVLAGLLGMSDDEIDDLVENQIVY
jgi:benzylsuccinate CoA-transferase BbsF subunit